MNKLTILGVIMLIMFSFGAYGAKYDQFLLNSSKQAISDDQAQLEALQGKPVFICTAGEWKTNKSGRGGSVRNVKKPKDDIAIDAQIEELIKQKGSN